MTKLMRHAVAIVILSLAAGCASQTRPPEPSQPALPSQSASLGAMPLGAGDVLGTQLFSNDELASRPALQMADIRD